MTVLGENILFAFGKYEKVSLRISYVMFSYEMYWNTYVLSKIGSWYTDFLVVDTSEFLKHIMNEEMTSQFFKYSPRYSDKKNQQKYR